ncbi:hypothetical protein ACFQH3_01365 [Haladaptatus sp. GCM10025707]|uniref:hypothetical protein n=1 Tax=Haladaptatus sp. GCM10025707 TaxID=3252658 RepID=UPI00360944F5
MGFVALYLAIVSAYQSPATAYEVSIYAATPDGFWAGIGIAVVCGLLVAWFVTPTNRIRTLAILLVASAIVAVAALPIIRGYFFVGAGDSLTHLGWMRDIESGALSPSISCIRASTPRCCSSRRSPGCPSNERRSSSCLPTSSRLSSLRG